MQQMHSLHSASGRCVSTIKLWVIKGWVAWCSVYAFDPINKVIVCWAQLVLRWVTAGGQENHLGM